MRRYAARSMSSRGRCAVYSPRALRSSPPSFISRHPVPPARRRGGGGQSPPTSGGEGTGCGRAETPWEAESAADRYRVALSSRGIVFLLVIWADRRSKWICCDGNTAVRPYTIKRLQSDAHLLILIDYRMSVMSLIDSSSQYHSRRNV